ncbi:MAG: carboxymethylenebutenolidase [Alphaproteobacteria bacterium]|jgi:carboxymethylenebutenolidase
METIHIDIHGHAMDMLVDGPAGPGPHPAALLMYHRGGFDSFTLGRLEALREAGFVTCVPNFYHRCPDGHELDDCKQFLKDSEVLAEIAASAEYLRNRADVDAQKMFIFGHCMGGRIAMMGAAKTPLFRGCVVFYGGGMFVSWGDEGATPFDWIDTIPCPVIGFFGGKDVNPSPDDVNRVDEKLTQAGVAHSFHRYPDVGHGFQNPSHDAPETRAASKDAWAKALHFMATP